MIQIDSQVLRLPLALVAIMLISGLLAGTLLSSEVDIEYKFDNGIALGAGYAALSTDLDVEDSGWDGSITDSHCSLMMYASYYF
jgi:hypothetical protein